MENTNGKTRIEKEIQKALPNLSKTQIQECLRKGWIQSKLGHHIKKGRKDQDFSELDFSRLEEWLCKVREGNPELLFKEVGRGEGYVIVDKPAGVPSHPLRISDFHTVTHWAFAQYPETRQEFLEPQPTITPHRLDTGTSGALLVSLTKSSYLEWRDRFQKKEVKKKYLAWCIGNPREQEFQNSKPIGPHPKNQKKRSTKASKGKLYPAQTYFTVEKRKLEKEIFLVRVECSTGVTHQVRIHLADLGFPLVGDRLYGEKENLRLGSITENFSFPLLRAYSLDWKDLHYEVSIEEFIFLFS